jgi:phage gp36-like protein
MPYCTRQNLIDKYGRPQLILLTDIDEERTYDIVDSVVDEAIADADKTIDRYLGPGADPGDIADIARRLAFYALHSGGRARPPEVREDYEDAIAELKAMAKGDLRRPEAAAGATLPSGGTVEIVTGGHTFSRNDNGFI